MTIKMGDGLLEKLTGRKPHKHAAVIKAWADGATIQVRNKDFGSCECGPEWRDLTSSMPCWYECDIYRIKPKEYPKTEMSEDDLKSAYWGTETIKQFGPFALADVANIAIENFLRSQAAVDYFLNPDNGFITFNNY